MKKVFLLLVLAVFAAGVAFAQRVGDTVQLSGQTYVVESVSGGKVLLQILTLDGVWQTGNNGGIHTINGSNGVFTQIDPSNLWRDAVNNGIIKVGDPVFRNLRKTGDLTWTGEVSLIVANRNVATGMRWDDCTITLNPNGQTFRLQYPGGSQTQNRRQLTQR
jgi:GTP-dependent phosphoenolpyruvate carboxykinase